VEVLQGGHAFSILVVRVEKPTDNSLAQSFCHRTWLMLILQEISPALAPAHFPTPLRAPGPAATSTELTGPVAEGGTGRRNKTQIPLRGHTREGDKGRARMSSPRRTARGRNYARPIRHSEDRKVALNRNYCRSVIIKTLGLFGICLFHFSLLPLLTASTSHCAPAARRCSPDCGP
jgi:hypothetical protein